MAERKDSRLPSAAGTAQIYEDGVVPMDRGGALVLSITQYSCRVLLHQVHIVLLVPSHFSLMFLCTWLVIHQLWDKEMD